MKIYVNANAGHDGNGTIDRPFRRINEAARAARPGDEVLVAPESTVNMSTLFMRERKTRGFPTAAQRRWAP